MEFLQGCTMTPDEKCEVSRQLDKLIVKVDKMSEILTAQNIKMETTLLRLEHTEKKLEKNDRQELPQKVQDLNSRISILEKGCKYIWGLLSGLLLMIGGYVISRLFGSM